MLMIFAVVLLIPGLESLSPFLHELQPIFGQQELSPEAMKGRADARAAIKAGQPRLVYIGYPEFNGAQLDAETGLLTRSLGCIMSPGRRAYRDAFNATMRAALKGGRLAGKTLKAKVTTLQALQSRFMHEKSITLKIGQTIPCGPARQYSMTLARLGAPPSLACALRVMCTATKSVGRVKVLHLERHRMTLLVDKKSDVIVVRVDYGSFPGQKNYVTYRTYDLGLMKCLQLFSASK